MSSVDDARRLLQDIISPDLKALAAKIEAGEALNKQRYEALNQRFTDADKLSTVRYEALLQAIQTGNATTNAKVDSLVKNLSLDHRMELLEARLATPTQGATREERS